MKTLQFTHLDNEHLREAQQILDEIMDDVRSPLHNIKHPRHEQVKKAVAELENEIFMLVCELDGQFQKIDINNNNQQEKLESVQNAQAGLCKKSRNRRSKQDFISNKSRVRRKVKGAVTIENSSLTISSGDAKQ